MYIELELYLYHNSLYFLLFLKGIKLHYVEKGDPKNPLIVFVHGFPEFWYSWRHQLKEFSKDYWTIAIDQRGYGQTDKPSSISEYHINNMADDINALVKSLGEVLSILSHTRNIIKFHLHEESVNNKKNVSTDIPHAAYLITLCASIASLIIYFS